MYYVNMSAPFSDLRTSYLQAIARAWSDRTFYELLQKASVHFPRGVLDVLESEYGVKFPFDRLKLTIKVDSGLTWNTQYPYDWFGARTDRMLVTLPPKPTDRSEGAWLAAYCAEYPSPLGRCSTSGLDAPDDFVWFGTVIGRLIALTWKREDVEQALTTQYQDDARGYVQNILGIMIPWNFKVQFKVEKDWHPGSHTPYMTEIRLNFPQKPPADECGEEAFALATYNGSGGQYPFTCF